MLINGLTLLGMIGVMGYVNWRFTLIALSVIPALSLVVYSLTHRIKEASRDVREKESELVSVVEEVLTSARVVKAFAREDYESQRFASQSSGELSSSIASPSAMTVEAACWRRSASGSSLARRRPSSERRAPARQRLRV
jgi:ABC-type multidrug transport system fused ATPase/permease subunit